MEKTAESVEYFENLRNFLRQAEIDEYFQHMQNHHKELSLVLAAFGSYGFFETAIANAIQAIEYHEALMFDTPQWKACMTCKYSKTKIVRKKPKWYCEHDEGIDKEADVGWCDMNDFWEWRGPIEGVNYNVQQGSV